MTPQLHAEQTPAFASFTQAGVTPCEAPLSEPVGQRLTDDAREVAIARAGKAIERHMSAFQALEKVHECTGCFADIGEAERQLRMAHQAQELMTRLIKGRSKAQVLRLEIKRGLI